MSGADVDELLRLIDAGESWEALRLVDAWHARHGSVAAAVTGLLAPAQVEVGRRWQRSEWTVAQEHAATAVVDDALGALSLRQPPAASEKRALLCCAEEEWHVAPARMAAAILRERGWKVRFLGGSMPAEHLRRTLVSTPGDVLVVSCTIPLALPGAARSIRAGHDAGLPVLLGGGATTARRAHRLGADAWAPDPDAAAGIMDRWLDRPPAPAQPMAADGEHAVLLEEHVRIAAGAFGDLHDELPAMRSYRPDQLARTREDLDYILRFLAVSLLVDDEAIMDDFVGWLVDVLVPRGVGPDVVATSLRALARNLPEATPRARALLERHAAQLGALA